MLILSAAQAAHSQLVKGRETERDTLTERERARGRHGERARAARSQFQFRPPLYEFRHNFTEHNKLKPTSKRENKSLTKSAKV